MKSLSTDVAKLFKFLDNMEALISHNESDISSWLPIEYKENLTYSQENSEWSTWTKHLMEEIKQDSIDKINREQNSILPPTDSMLLGYYPSLFEMPISEFPSAQPIYAVKSLIKTKRLCIKAKPFQKLSICRQRFFHIRYVLTDVPCRILAVFAYELYDSRADYDSVCIIRHICRLLRS